MEITTQTPLDEIAVRLGVAVLLGAILGLDRELRGKPAGLRTHMLIALGAAATSVVALELYSSLVKLTPDTRADPLRAIGAVMAGIGFLGAGVIIRDRAQVYGMTTAANIWLCAAMGLACGAGYYGIAGITFGFALVILTILLFAERLFKRPRE